MSNIIDARAAVWKSIIDFDKYLKEADEVNAADFEQVKQRFKEFDLLLKGSLNSVITPSVSEYQIHEKLDEIMYNSIGSEPPPKLRNRETSPAVNEIFIDNSKKFLILRGNVFNIDSIDYLDTETRAVTLRSGKTIALDKPNFDKLFYFIQCNKIA